MWTVCYAKKFNKTYVYIYVNATLKSKSFHAMFKFEMKQFHYLEVMNLLPVALLQWQEIRLTEFSRTDKSYLEGLQV